MCAWENTTDDCSTCLESEADPVVRSQRVQCEAVCSSTGQLCRRWRSSQTYEQGPLCKQHYEIYRPIAVALIPLLNKRLGKQLSGYKRRTMRPRNGKQPVPNAFSVVDGSRIIIWTPPTSYRFYQFPGDKGKEILSGDELQQMLTTIMDPESNQILIERPLDSGGKGPLRYTIPYAIYNKLQEALKPPMETFVKGANDRLASNHGFFMHETFDTNLLSEIDQFI
jgi:hypothetical protein